MSRRRILQGAHLAFDVVPSRYEEHWEPRADPTATVLELATGKAREVAARCPGAYVLGCDSLLLFDGTLYGKVATADDAARRWRSMRGRSGVLYTGHALIYDDRIERDVAATTVTFATLDDEEIAAYVATGEPIGPAGAFTLEGRSSAFITRVDGEPSNVLGLSVPTLRGLLARYGVAISSLWI